jgi:hypothetical protein
MHSAHAVLLLAILCIGLLASPGFARAMAEDLYSVKLAVEDANGEPVSGATLQISGYGNVVSGVSGVVYLQLRAGRYDVSVSFFSVPVFTGSITVAGPVDTAIKCAIFSVDVTITGLGENATILAMAKLATGTVTVRSQTGTSIRFPQLPSGPATILLFAPVEGLTCLVADKEIQLDRNTVFTLPASFDYRAITVKVLDQSGRPVGDALVRLDEKAMNVTDAAGRTMVFARDGSHMLGVHFYGFSVFTDRNVRVWRDDIWVINASVSALELKLLDENSNPVRGLPVLLQIGTYNFTLSSNSEGVVKLSQAPYAPMSVSVLRNVPSRFVFAGAPVTVHVLTHGLDLTAEPIRAYMLGPLTIKVEVHLGEILIKNATVRLKRGPATLDKATTERGYALLSTALGLESEVLVEIEASALGQVASRQLVVNTNPTVLTTMPFAFVPIIMFEVLRRRVRGQLQAPPTVNKRKRKLSVS